MKPTVYESDFLRAYFSYADSQRDRLNVLLNEINYRSDELVELLQKSVPPDSDLAGDDIKEVTRALTLIEDQIKPECIRRLPQWFWDDSRFYGDPKKPDFVIDNEFLRKYFMGRMLDGASTTFLQRNTFFHRPSLILM